MPHISIKCYPGRTEEQKQELARRITEDVVEVMGSPSKSVTVAIEEVNPEDWNSQVWDKEIGPKIDELYKKPGYQRG